MDGRIDDGWMDEGGVPTNSSNRNYVFYFMYHHFMMVCTYKYLLPAVYSVRRNPSASTKLRLHDSVFTLPLPLRTLDFFSHTELPITAHSIDIHKSQGWSVIP
ncbi:hypothetical protein EYR41_011974 [Orbilia oligospora]|uniref:Uncharacterized protein n=1 Tax=Orbilia oligospora TaxID=2813651 RepID=A0A7C8KB36_ORBOL|nr:hypothetical protein TWF751_002631 [Orbilia oligospora]TGJ62793.1 hypothetical protein EYR41_011974 [Orbilia oligospora]